MPAASLALRQALTAALNAHAPLVSALGGAKVHDEPPRTVAFPYVTLGDASAADWSTATSSGAEHRLVLHVWSREGGTREAQIIAGELMAALETAPLALAGHRLVNLRFASVDIRREADGRTYHGLVRFRAVTEPV